MVIDQFVEAVVISVCVCVSLSVPGGGRRIGVFVSKGGTGILLQLVISASKVSPPSEELMLQLHSVLAKVGPKGYRCTRSPNIVIQTSNIN